ncbi:MAG: hypothetical protein QXG98_06200 [Candidatus Micrarchaeia archaeon]
MGIFDIFRKKDVGEGPAKGVPFSLRARFSPIRMSLKDGVVDLHITLKNLMGENVMTSVVVEVPKGLGFDATGLSNTREIRLGYLREKEERELVVPIHGSVVKTPPGEYNVTITAYAHYRDYAHILNSVRKTVSLRVI